MASSAIISQLTTFQIGTGTGGAKTITGITQANPCVVTSTAHGLSRGDVVTFSSIAGMTQLNAQTAIVQYTTVNTLVLANVDSTGYTAYTSGGSATPQTFTAIANIKSFSGFDGAAADIETSNLMSTAKEYLVGLQDMGSMTLELDLDTTDLGQQALLTAQTSQAKKSFKLTLPNNAVASFSGFSKKVGTAGGVDQAIKRSVEIKITGAVTWS